MRAWIVMVPFWNMSAGNKNDIHKMFVIDLAFNLSAGEFTKITGSEIKTL